MSGESVPIRISEPKGPGPLAGASNALHCELLGAAAKSVRDKQRCLKQLLTEAAAEHQGLLEDPGTRGEEFRNARAAAILATQDFDRAFPAMTVNPGDGLIFAMFEERCTQVHDRLALATSDAVHGLGGTGWLIAIGPAIGVICLFAVALGL